MEKLRVVLYGVGAIGSRIAKLLLEKNGAEIVGAIDMKKEKVGKDLGEVLGIGKRLGVAVSDDPDTVLSKVNASIVIHSTTSFLKQVYPQITKIVKHGVNVVSTCEELSYPYVTNPELAKKLDESAKKNKVTVLGTGINPGFMMDTLAIALTGVCQTVERIKVTRVLNAAKRRVQLQKKIGVGLTIGEFKEKMEKKSITLHVGLEQSVFLIASALGWKLDETKVESKAIQTKLDKVAGLGQHGRGIKRGKEIITLDLQAYVDPEEEYDAIDIEGVPSIHMKLSPGVHGDLGTVAVIVNSIPKVINAKPGLVTMKDLPVPSATPEDMRTYVKK